MNVAVGGTTVGSDSIGRRELSGLVDFASGRDMKNSN
jgi:hypothetical protein